MCDNHTKKPLIYNLFVRIIALQLGTKFKKNHLQAARPFCTINVNLKTEMICFSATAFCAHAVLLVLLRKAGLIA